MKNGIPAAALSELTHEVAATPTQGIAGYGVNLQWLSGTRAKARALPMTVGSQSINRQFEWMIDEPKQLGGSNHAPSPQEYLLSGFGSCLMVAFLVGATVNDIQLSQLEIEIRGELDLAGFLSARPDARVPLSGITYTVRVSGDGTPEQFEAIRQAAQKHSPNAMSLAQGVPVSGTLEVV